MYGTHIVMYCVYSYVVIGAVYQCVSWPSSACPKVSFWRVWCRISWPIVTLVAWNCYSIWILHWYVRCMHVLSWNYKKIYNLYLPLVFDMIPKLDIFWPIVTLVACDWYWTWVYMHTIYWTCIRPYRQSNWKHVIITTVDWIGCNWNTLNTNYKCLQTVHMHAQSMVIYYIHNQFKYGWEITGIGQVICVQSGSFASLQSRTKWSISQPILKPVSIWWHANTCIYLVLYHVQFQYNPCMFDNTIIK